MGLVIQVSAMFFFFFSSRRRHTRFDCDWSSDVCSSDLSWCAVVGMPTLGLVAAAEFGIALDRLALVPDPGPEWPTVVAALLDGVDVVVAAPPGPVAAPLAGRLAARARQRGSVLLPCGSR